MADASGFAGMVSQSAMSPIDMLIMAVPGKPGEDYPILASVPETAFSCEGRTEGGYYADVSCDYLKKTIHSLLDFFFFFPYLCLYTLSSIIYTLNIQP